MARDINSRIKITGILKAKTPLHVGGLGGSFETDMALAKNGNDQFYIPGTSLTGALRSWFKDRFSEANPDSIWGFQEGDKGHASFVSIEDLQIPESVQPEIRDGVGIDRHYGTAAYGVKFDRTILPRGTCMNFEMTVEIGVDHEANNVKAMFGQMLAALERGEIRLGSCQDQGTRAGRSRGCEYRREHFEFV